MIHFGPLIGRILLGFLFLFAGFGKLISLSGTAEYLEFLGLPLPFALAMIVGIFEFAAGLAIIIGWSTRIAAFGLAFFSITMAFMFHFEIGNQAEFGIFMKNLAIAGGLILLGFHGAGPFSLDRRRERIQNSQTI